MGTKAVTFAKIPAFDQLAEYVYQTAPVDGKSGISVGVAIGTCTVEKAGALLLGDVARDGDAA